MPCRNAYIEIYRRSEGKLRAELFSVPDSINECKTHSPRPTIGNRIGTSNHTKLECFKVDTFSFRILFVNCVYKQGGKRSNSPLFSL